MEKILFGMILLLAVQMGFAQKQNPKAKKTAYQKSFSKKQEAWTRLHSNAQYHARSTEALRIRRLQISDNTINTLNQRTARPGANGSGLPGVPKGTYGFANGRILLYSNAATSSGTTTGSGSAGTGSSPAGVGTSGRSTGTNGKNPYEGFGAYGTRLPATLHPFDSIQNKRQ